MEIHQNNGRFRSSVSPNDGSCAPSLRCRLWYATHGIPSCQFPSPNATNLMSRPNYYGECRATNEACLEAHLTWFHAFHSVIFGSVKHSIWSPWPHDLLFGRIDILDDSGLDAQRVTKYVQMRTKCASRVRIICFLTLTKRSGVPFISQPERTTASCCGPLSHI